MRPAFSRSSTIDQLQRRQARGSTDRVAGERRAVGAGRPRPDRFAGDERADRHARRDALGGGDDVRLDAGLLDRPPRAGASHAGLDLVGDQQDAVLVADVAQPLQESRRGREVAALALDRLDHDRRHIARRDEAPEDRAAQHLELGAAVAAGTLSPGTDARERGVMDHRQQRPEAGPLLDLRVGQGQGTHRAAVEAALEGDDPGPMGVVAGELDRALDRLRAGVGQEDACLLLEWRDRRQALHELQVARLEEIGGGDVDQPIRLLLDRLHHRRMRMAGRADGDAGGEVKEDVAVDIGHRHAGSRFRHEGIGAGKRRARDRLVARDQRAGLRAGQLGDDPRGARLPGSRNRRGRLGGHNHALRIGAARPARAPG